MALWVLASYCFFCNSLNIYDTSIFYEESTDKLYLQKKLYSFHLKENGSHELGIEMLFTIKFALSLKLGYFDLYLDVGKVREK